MCLRPAPEPATPPSNKTWGIHCGVEVTELSTNKQHTLSQSTGSCAPAWGRGQPRRRTDTMCKTRPAEGGAGPCPRLRPHRRRRPTRHVPRQQKQTGGKEDILLSTTGPSTDRCSKDVTTHQHRPGSRPGRPYPIPACSGQPLPGERRFNFALGNRVFNCVKHPPPIHDCDPVGDALITLFCECKTPARGTCWENPVEGSE